MRQIEYIDDGRGCQKVVFQEGLLLKKGFMLNLFAKGMGGWLSTLTLVLQSEVADDDDLFFELELPISCGLALRDTTADLGSFVKSAISTGEFEDNDLYSAFVVSALRAFGVVNITYELWDWEDSDFKSLHLEFSYQMVNECFMGTIELTPEQAQKYFTFDRQVYDRRVEEDLWTARRAENEHGDG